MRFINGGVNMSIVHQPVKRLTVKKTIVRLAAGATIVNHLPDCLSVTAATDTSCNGGNVYLDTVLMAVHMGFQILCNVRLHHALVG